MDSIEDRFEKRKVTAQRMSKDTGEILQELQDFESKINRKIIKKFKVLAEETGMDFKELWDMFYEKIFGKRGDY